ncbi:MAG: 50S ribosomal protein L22 [Candidatus Melainabacteria bacterium RIFCSPLOWO2_02_FULL_35_15]|nr:MAG: 50S ribosomal protein L22 [Candidatus Melainabacteria bacterium RIFCSPLOWO2_12_FULL_35_11]OGI12855.1 MAG: 50S ribosomal protein L22 [Candidatus Melainabacteria bacterium RIFCSPLOWO2_02_FULL_35_15]
MTKAIAKYIRMSPRKLRRVVNEIRGKDTNSAQVILKFMPYAGARVVEKVLKSAVSNAKENEKLNPDELRITKAFVDQSTTLRRWRPMSRGRGYPILKRTSHVTLEVGVDENLINNIKHTPAKKQVKHDHDHDHKHDHDEKSKDEAVKKEKKQVKEKTKKDKKKKEE